MPRLVSTYQEKIHGVYKIWDEVLNAASNLRFITMSAKNDGFSAVVEVIVKAQSADFLIKKATL
jgi:hypothetical protein